MTAANPALELVPESPLDRLAREVRSHHQQAEAAWQNAVEHAYRCGEVLIEAKALCKHGTWLPWLAEVGIPARTAQDYMRLAKNADPRILPPTIGEALAALTRPRPSSQREDLWSRWQRLVGDVTPRRGSAMAGYETSGWGDDQGRYARAHGALREGIECMLEDRKRQLLADLHGYSGRALALCDSEASAWERVRQLQEGATDSEPEAEQ